MTRWSPRRVFGLVLALMLGLGMALGGANATAMNSKMMAAADMPMSGDCNGCGDTAMPSCCTTTCVAPAPAILPPSPVAAAAAPGDFQPLAFLTGTGQAGPPDPYPPKPSLHA